MLSRKEKSVLKKQLNAIQGQLKAIEKMVEKDRDVEEIFIQCKAVEGIIQKAIYGVMDELLRKKFAEVLVKAVNDCPGECPNCDNIEELKKQFANMSLKEVHKYLLGFNPVLRSKNIDN